MQPLDAKDRKLLKLLQQDSAMPAEALGEAVGLSVTSVQRRIKRLVADQVIARQSSVLSPEKLGFPVRCIVGVELDAEHPDALAEFKAQIDAESRIQQSYFVTGATDFVLVILARDMSDYVALTQRLFVGNRNVLHFTTSVVMKACKAGLDVPTEEL